MTIYRLTEVFPPSERFMLTAQMRRAAVSIGSNIAEGCGKGGDRALIACLQIAMGSASELEFQLSLAADFSYGATTSIEAAIVELHQLMRMLSRLIVALRESGARSRRPSDYPTSRPP